MCHTDKINHFRQYTIDYKLETYLKIARLYLEDDDPVQAEAFINRASLLQVCGFFCSYKFTYKYDNYFILSVLFIYRPSLKMNNYKSIIKSAMQEY